MVTLEAKWQCDTCGAILFWPVILKNDWTITHSPLPDGWKIDFQLGVLRVFCPKHIREAR